MFPGFQRWLVGAALLLIGAGALAARPQQARLRPALGGAQDLPGSSVRPSALAVDRAGEAHAAFITAAHTVVYQPPHGPASELGSAGDARHTETTVSLALQPDEAPGVAYVDDRSGDLVLCELRDGDWQTERLDLGADRVGYFPSLAYDRRGQPHLTFFNHSQNDLLYATRGAGGWRIETVDASGEPGFFIPAGFSSLALATGADGQASPRVAYLGFRYKPYDGALRYAEREPWGWRSEEVDTATSAGAYPALALDADGEPWISYHRVSTWDFNRGEVRVASRQPDGWEVSVIDSRRNAGRHNALTILPDGTPLLAYYDGDKGDLYLAWKERDWRRATLLTEGNVGAWVRIACGAAGAAHLTFADAPRGTTRMAVLRMELTP